MPPKVAGQGERPNPEAAASAFLNAVTCISDLEGNPEAAGRYVAAWLCRAHKAHQQAEPGLAAAVASAVGSFGRTSTKEHYAVAAFAERQLRWCLAALKDPSAVQPPLPGPPPTLEAIKEDSALCAAPPLSLQLELQWRAYLRQQVLSERLAVQPILLAYLLVSCWSAKRAEDAAVAVCAWAAAQWFSDREEPAEWMDIHSIMAEGLAKNLPPLLKTMQDGPLTSVLRSLHQLLLTGPRHMLEAIQGYGSGALIEVCAQMLGPSSKRSQAARAAAAHFLAAIAWPTCIHRTVRQSDMWLLRWPAVTVECCKLLGSKLGAYNQHGGPEQQYSAWYSMLGVVNEAGKTGVSASTLAAAQPGRAVVRLLRVCLEPVPRIKGNGDVGEYYVKLQAPHNSPGKHLSGALHQACLRDCLRCIGFFCAHATLFHEMVAAGLVGELHSLFSRQLPAAVLEDACMMLGVLATRSDEFPELLAYPASLMRGHYLRVRREESEIYGVPYALCQWAKSGQDTLMCLTWAVELGSAIRPALSQRDPGAPVVSTPSKRYGLAALLWLAGSSLAVWNRLLSVELLSGVVAEVDEIAQRLGGVEGELDADGNPQWSNGALELLDAVDYVLGTPDAARALLKAGLLDGVLGLLSGGWFDEHSAFLAPLLTLVMQATSDDDFLATCQESPQLTRALLGALDDIGAAVLVPPQGRTMARIPKATGPLVQLMSMLWSPDVAIDVPHAPDRKRLVQLVSMLVAAVWEASEQRSKLSEVRMVVKMMCNVLTMMDFLEGEQLPSSAVPIAHLLCTTLKREADYGASHFKDHSDQCCHCMHHFGENLIKVSETLGYFCAYESYLPVMALAKIPMELDRLIHVINRHLSQEPWAPLVRDMLQDSIATIKEGELKARKLRKQASAPETSSSRVQDLSAAEAAARKAEAELLAELEAEERQQKKKGGQEGQGQKGGKGGKAAKKGKGKKKQKGTAAQQPARARAASPASEGQSESEDEGAAASLTVPQVNTSGLDARSIAASLTAGSLAGASSRGSLNGMHGAAEEAAEAGAEAVPATGREGHQDEAVEGYLRMIAQLEAEAEEGAGNESSWMGAGRGHGSGGSSSWEAAAGAEGAQGGRKGRVMAVQRPASARNPVVQPPPPPPPRRQQPPRLSAQQPMPAGAASPPVPQPMGRPSSAPMSPAPALTENGSSGQMDGSRLLQLLQHAPPMQQVQQAQQAQQQRVQQPGFPVSSASAAQAADFLPSMQPPPAPPAVPAEHDVAAADDLDAIMPWLIHSIPQQQQQQQQAAVGTPQKQAPAPGQRAQGSSGVASPLVDLLHQLLPPEGAGHTEQGVEEMGAGRVAAVGQEADPALRHVLSCPLTKVPYVDPVIAEDGVTYERAAIWAHLQQGGTSPLTGQPLQLGSLKPNHAVRAAVEAFLPQ